MLPASYDTKVTLVEKKLLRALAKSKTRKEENSFLVEGAKAVAECLTAFECRLMIATSDGYCLLQQVYTHETKYPLKNRLRGVAKHILLPNEYDFSSLSLLQHPRPIIAVFTLPTDTGFFKRGTSLPFSLLLDGVQDPGNVGSIIRTADWFGISSVYLTSDSADPYSPKVVQASMGSIAHLSIKSLKPDELATFLFSFSEKSSPIIGTFLNGESLFYPLNPLPSLSSSALLVMGNEGRGISEEVARFCSRRITIPSLSSHSHGESLNVAVATAILLTAFAK